MNEEQKQIDRLMPVFVIAFIIAGLMATALNEIDHEQEAAIAACRFPVRRTR